MRAKKSQDPKKNGTIRPWLVDVVIDNLRERKGPPAPNCGIPVPPSRAAARRSER